MPTQKKKQSPAPDNKPKHKVGTKLYFMDFSGTKPKVLIGEVMEIASTTFPERDETTRKIVATHVAHSYSLDVKGRNYDVSQHDTYQNFQSVAIAFAKIFFIS